MPPEGQNKSEEMLQRYAKERREQAGDFSLHPAGRRLLQGEVTRQFDAARKAGAGRAGWFAAWRGRLAFGAALVAVIATGVAVFKNGQSDRPVLQLADTKAVNTVLFGAPEGKLQPDNKKEIATLGRAELSDESGPRPAASSRGATMEDAKRTVAKPEAETLVGNTLSYQNVSAGDKTLGEMAVNSYALGVNDKSGYRPPPAATTPVSTQPSAAALQIANGTLLPSPARESAAGAAFNYASDNYQRRPEVSEAQKGKAQSSLALLERADGTEDRVQSLRFGGAMAPAPAAANAPAARVATLAAESLAKTEARANDTVTTAAVTPQLQTPQNSARYFRQSVSAPPSTDARAKLVADSFAKQSAPPGADAQVLARFDLEQTGDALRIVDADGSVYDGTMGVAAESVADLDAVQAKDKGGLFKEKAVALQSRSAARGEDYSFRASGSNVTLRQLVVVRGRFTQDANRAASGGSVTGGGSGAAAPVARRAVLPAARGFGGAAGFGTMATNQSVFIEGTVLIGATNQQFFRAARSP